MQGFEESSHEGSRGAIRAISPSLKPTKVILITMILYNSEKSILDIRPFCCSLFCHSSVVKYYSNDLTRVFLRCFRDPIRAPRFANRVPRIR